eukprot:scaffold8982_cov125-Isochrysis_galbana.AAC.2
MDKGAARVRVDSTDESSLQPAQRTAGALPVHWPELRLLAWVVSAAKTPLGVAAPPITTTAKSCPLQHPSGFGAFQIPVGVPTSDVWGRAILPLILFVSTLAGIDESIAALPREVRANQQSRISFHVLALASKYLSIAI